MHLPFYFVKIVELSKKNFRKIGNEVSHTTLNKLELFRFCGTYDFTKEIVKLKKKLGYYLHIQADVFNFYTDFGSSIKSI